MEITIDIPEEVLDRLGTPEERSRRVCEALVMAGYRDGSLTRRQVGDILGLGLYATEEWLKERGLDFGYTMEDLEHDRNVLAELLDDP